jgi:hypothetical protein
MSGNSTIKKLGYLPEAIMINIPTGYFNHLYDELDTTKTLSEWQNLREKAFRHFYESMGSQIEPDRCFYHFISTCPSADIEPHITSVYVCFRGFVQYKAILVKFMRNQPVMLPDYKHPEPRNWCVTTGPVIKAPSEISIKGFRGFRYTEHLF